MTAKSPVRRTPGPGGGWLLGSLRDYRRDPLAFLLDVGRRYDDIARMRLAHLPVFLITEPAYIKHVLQTHRHNYAKGPSYDALRLVLGNGLLVADGPLWLRQRRMLQPFFNYKPLVAKLDTIVESVQVTLDRWDALPDGAEVDLVAEMMALAFEVVGRTLASTDLSTEMETVDSVLRDVSDWVYRRVEAAFKLPVHVPTPANLRFLRHRKALRQVVDRVIARHRRDTSRGGLLSALIDARDDETDERMDQVQLRDEVLTLLLAGHETTGDALCWTFMQLDAHAPVAARVRAEVDDVLDDRSPDAGALAALTFTTGVIDESMRLYPPAWLFTRTAVADDVIDGHAIPRKAFVLISPYVNHRLPRFWGERADDFDPDRFAASSAEGRERYAYFPFGGGPHACIGKHVSYIELQVAVAMIARRYDIRFIPGQRFEPLPRISLLPSDAMRVTLHRRAA